MAIDSQNLVRVGIGIYRYQTKSGEERFMASIKHHDRYTRKLGFPTVSKAKHWRKSRMGCIADGRLFPELEAKRQEEARKQQEAEEERQRLKAEAALIVTFKAYGETFMKAKRALGLKYTTLKRYQSILNIHLIPAFGVLSLAEINRGKVRELVGQLSEKGMHPKSIKNIVLCLSAIYTDAIEDGHVQHNPALNTAKLIKTTKTGQDVAPFTHEEEYLLLKTVKEQYSHYYAFILLLFRTGLREGEAIALRPEDLDLRKRSVWVQRNFTAGQLSNTPKSRQKRKVDLSQDLVAVLKDYLVIQEAEALLSSRTQERWLFSTPSGSMIRSNNFRDRVWKPLLKAANLPYLWIHSTRHTFATRLIENGANIVYVQKQLGHSSIQLTVDTYCHWIKESERNAGLEVDRLIGPPLGDGCTPGCTPKERAGQNVERKEK